jgi:hypothetical protein
MGRQFTGRRVPVHFRQLRQPTGLISFEMPADGGLTDTHESADVLVRQSQCLAIHRGTPLANFRVWIVKSFVVQLIAFLCREFHLEHRDPLSGWDSGRKTFSRLCPNTRRRQIANPCSCTISK